MSIVNERESKLGSERAEVMGRDFPSRCASFFLSAKAKLYVSQLWADFASMGDREKKTFSPTSLSRAIIITIINIYLANMNHFWKVLSLPRGLG